jgi:purine-binding chemotaxis protein CheW
MSTREPNSPATPDARSGKYLTFHLGAEEYGIEILKVQEIIGLLPITMVPNTPHFIRGIINLRGKIIPVVDLRAKLGMETLAASNETCIVVVRRHTMEMGVVVDRVKEVLDIKSTEIEHAPEFGAQVDTSCLLGIGKHNGQVKLLLDIDRVLDSTGLMQAPTAGPETA